jgi:hypothetical protein
VETSPSTPRPSRGRLLLARILIFLGALFVLLSLLAGFVRFQALDTDTVTETAGLMIENEQIRAQIAASLVDSLYANVDVTGQLEEDLPPNLQGLAGPAAAGLRELTDRAALRLLERPRAQELWVNTVAFSHAEIIDVLEDDVRGLSTEEGVVFLDLRPLVIELGERFPIVGRLASQLPNDAGRIKVLEADQLERAQDITRLLKFLGTWLWVVPVLLWAAAVWLAAGRRRVILRSVAIASILSGLLVLVVRRLAGSYVVEELAGAESVKPAVQDAWDIITRQLVDGGWTLVGLGVIVLIAAWLAGPGRSAVAARTELAPFLARWEIAYGVAAALFLLLLLWSPTVQTTRVQLMLAAAIVLAVGVEVLRRQVGREHPEAAGVDLGEHTRGRFERVRRRGGDG